ncbi:sensor histidine kinase [Desulfurivibrio dismutans]|uniref:sensor histidine kinase n=1 Tax=Desulfurivibrio dismutans TaxID=1398908 RepID=UPI0023DB5793|nr:ATP-binding protein [Desulfurivibrio alkaliphilus]MDF1614931.1 DUF3365 domain-containing protein [Desulfurivibrio alkaliphilus]
MNLTLMHRLLLVAALIGWTLTVGGFFFWDLRLAREHMEELAIKEARSNFNKDLSFRLWASRHGGVYVPVDERTQPSPGLEHLPERDILTPSGRQLTLMNPAYMLHQMMAEYGDYYGVHGRIVGFRPINPINAPDYWERSALSRFQQGAEEVLEFFPDGDLRLRLMRPIEARESCLKCHTVQGYQVGDVLGGIGVSVSLQPYLETLVNTRKSRTTFFGVIWILGMTVILLLNTQILRRLRAQDEHEKELRAQRRALRRANTDLTRLAEVSAHHLQEPSRRLLTFSQLLRDRLNGAQTDPEVARALEFVEHNATYLRNLVRDIKQFLDADQPRATMTEVPMEQVVEQVWQNLSPLVRESRAEINVLPLPPAFFDLPRLQDVIFVLLENAMLYGVSEKPPKIEISGEALGTMNRYRVSDNGPGVPSSYRLRVFEIFERLNGGSRGTGIGLPIARRIVESAGGEIALETSESGGLCVVFTLPAQPPAGS